MVAQKNRVLAEALPADEVISEEEITSLLLSLVEKSLVNLNIKTFDSARYSTLEIVKDYASEKFFNTKNTYKFLEKYTSYYSHYVSSLYLKLETTDLIQSMQLIAKEYDNITKALNVDFREEAHIEFALALAGKMYRYWHSCGNLEEAQKILIKLVSAKKKFGSGLTTNEALAKRVLGTVCYVLSKRKLSEKFLKESLSDFQILNDTLGKATVLCELGNLEYTKSNYIKAEHFFKESAELLLQLNDVARHTRLVGNLALVSLALEHYDEALQLAKNALKSSEEHSFEFMKLIVRIYISEIYIRTSDYDQSKKYLAESVETCLTLNDYVAMFKISEFYAELFAAFDEYLMSQKMLGVAYACRIRCAIPYDKREREIYGRLKKTIKKKLSKEQLQLANAETEWSIEQALSSAKDFWA